MSEFLKDLLWVLIPLGIILLFDFFWKFFKRSSIKMFYRTEKSFVFTLLETAVVFALLAYLIMLLLKELGYENPSLLICMLGAIIIGFVPRLCKHLKYFYEYLNVKTTLFYIRNKIEELIAYKTFDWQKDRDKYFSLANLAIALLPYPSIYYKNALKSLNKIERLCEQPISVYDKYGVYVKENYDENM